MTQRKHQPHQQQASSRDGRPSDARRKALADDLTVPDVSNFFPLERYYEAANKLFDSVVAISKKSAVFFDDKANKNNSKSMLEEAAFQNLDACYVYGKRYCEFVLTAIPQHNYFGTAKYKNLRVQHQHKQVPIVLAILEQTAERMDAQQVEHERVLAEQEAARFSAWQRKIQSQKKTAAAQRSSSTAISVEQSAMDKLNRLFGPPQQQQSEIISMGVPVAPPPPSSRTRHRLIDSDDEDAVLPPPMLPPPNKDHHAPTPLLPPTLNGVNDAPPPPSYDAVASRTHKHLPFYANNNNAAAEDTTSFTIQPLVPPEEYDNDNEQFVLPRPEQPLLPPQQQKKQLPLSRLPMRQQKEVYRQQYDRYRKMGKITVRPLQTYQGRVGGSTNGCTVISALTVARHLNHNNNSNRSISDGTIVDIIDRQCGPFLYEIRRKLGLGDHALIIPSDVHDHLVDAKILQQEYFAGAAGGNILDREHYGEFLKLLADDSKEAGNNNSNGNKAAATLFFREHVISIVKYRNNNGNGACCYDLIDSLPTANQGRCASRTVCSDIDALQVLLLWYASRKFSDSNCKTIDRNPWDDVMADLDPRVFQGFVWST